MQGYRKFTVALLSLVIPSVLLLKGYDVSKLSWLGSALAAFYGANLVERASELTKKYLEVKEKTLDSLKKEGK